VTTRTILASLFAVLLVQAGLAGAESEAPPPAAPAPAALAPSGALEGQLEQLADARRAVVGAERELRNATAALARASHGGSNRQIERLTSRQEQALKVCAEARRRVRLVVAQARSAGVSASILRSYEHSLYGS